MKTRLRGALQLVLAAGGAAMLAPAAFADDAPPPSDGTTTTTTTTTTSGQYGGQTYGAQAAPQPAPMAQPAQPTYVPPAEQYETTTKSAYYVPWGFTLEAGGGVSGFTDSTARNHTNTGGDWDVRAIFGTRLPLAAEVAYIGSAQSIDALGLDSSAVLVGNGVEGAVRLNVIPNYTVQPFIFAGAAWRHYSLTNEDFNTSDVANSDDVFEIPLGAGLTFKYRGLFIDARGEYRAVTSNDLMPSDNRLGSEAELHRWGAKAMLGYEF